MINGNQLAGMLLALRKCSYLGLAASGLTAHLSCSDHMALPHTQRYALCQLHSGVAIVDVGAGRGLGLRATQHIQSGSRLAVVPSKALITATEAIEYVSSSQHRPVELPVSECDSYDALAVYLLLCPDVARLPTTCPPTTPVWPGQRPNLILSLLIRCCGGRACQTQIARHSTGSGHRCEEDATAH